MAHFTGSLVLEEIGYEMWKVKRSFSFHSSGLVVSVEAGFETDLASIPGLARSFIPKIGYWSQPAVIHDIGYWGHREGVQVARSELTGEYVDLTRKDVDKLFMSGCEVKEEEYKIPVYAHRSLILYAGVRAGGLDNWETSKEREARVSADAPFQFIGD